MAVLLIAPVVTLLVLNEIGTNAENIRNFIAWIYCDAGVVCGHS